MLAGLYALPRTASKGPPTERPVAFGAVRGKLIERLAVAAVEVGANVQPDQVVLVNVEAGQEELARAVARAAYARGARFVDTVYFDSHVKRARLELAPEETLDWVPPWYGQRLRDLSRLYGARISLTPSIAPGVLDGLDPARAGKDALPYLVETFEVINARTTNWTVVPSPSARWASAVYPDLPEEEAYTRLWEELVHICRLDEEDPAEAWRARMETIEAACAKLETHRFDAIHFEGPATDLTVGLLPSSRWLSARWTTVDGIRHLANIPSEEATSAPDPERVDGVVRATRPLDVDGTVVRGLTVRFENGRAVEVEAEENADVLRGRLASDEGAARLGEIALVDRESRVGKLGTTFANTLLDENAASHLAFGNAYEICVESAEDRARLNASGIHIDFMIGSDEIAVDGLTASGERVPVLRAGAWQL
ncbi:MAG: aminopeptidase [Gaiellaceae bacterium]|nr:aminopeptidase [Gaiellaceae bacterium]